MTYNYSITTTYKNSDSTPNEGDSLIIKVTTENEENTYVPYFRLTGGGGLTSSDISVSNYGKQLPTGSLNFHEWWWGLNEKTKQNNSSRPN